MYSAAYFLVIVMSCFPAMFMKAPLPSLAENAGSGQKLWLPRNIHRTGLNCWFILKSVPSADFSAVYTEHKCLLFPVSVTVDLIL